MYDDGTTGAAAGIPVTSGCLAVLCRTCEPFAAVPLPTRFVLENLGVAGLLPYFASLRGVEDLLLVFAWLRRVDDLAEGVVTGDKDAVEVVFPCGLFVVIPFFSCG